MRPSTLHYQALALTPAGVVVKFDSQLARTWKTSTQRHPRAHRILSLLTPEHRESASGASQTPPSYTSRALALRTTCSYNTPQTQGSGNTPFVLNSATLLPRRQFHLDRACQQCSEELRCPQTPLGFAFSGTRRNITSMSTSTLIVNFKTVLADFAPPRAAMQWNLLTQPWMLEPLVLAVSLATRNLGKQQCLWIRCTLLLLRENLGLATLVARCAEEEVGVRARAQPAVRVVATTTSAQPHLSGTPNIRAPLSGRTHDDSHTYSCKNCGHTKALPRKSPPRWLPGLSKPESVIQVEPDWLEHDGNDPKPLTAI